MLRLQPQENRIYTVGVHWLIVLLQALSSLALLIAPLILYWVATIAIGITMGPSLTQLLTLLYFLWVSIIWIMFFFRWTDYYLDTWIITNKRVIEIEHKGMWHRDVASLRYESIQDVSIEIDGVLQTLLGIGDLYVQTAGTEKEFIYKNAANPEKIKQLISRLQSVALDKEGYQPEFD
jgi:uncharacterized membrane protein YdbT with pleckstrin-like domain